MVDCPSMVESKKRKEEEAQLPELLVPMLVSHDSGVAGEPIVSYNVIEQLLKIGVEHQLPVSSATVNKAFSLDCKKTEVLI